MELRPRRASEERIVSPEERGWDGQISKEWENAIMTKGGEMGVPGRGVCMLEEGRGLASDVVAVVTINHLGGRVLLID